MAEVRMLLSGARLHKFTPATLISADALMHRLAAIRGQGYSVIRAELDPDVLGIAAPVRDESGQVVAAVTVAVLASRIGAEAEPAGHQAATHVSDRQGPSRCGAHN